MSKKLVKNSVATAIGAAFIGSLAAAPAANASTNPFAVQALSSGYQVVAAEGNCGAKKETKATEANCGAKKKEAATDSKSTEGNCGAKKEKKATEGNCGANKGM